MRVRAIVIAVVLTASNVYLAQSQEIHGGTISGIVRDSAARPLANVDVSARPGAHQTRTDSTGRFTLTGLDNGTYALRARKVGYTSENWDVKISQSRRVDLAIVLAQRTAVLDTVRVFGQRECRQTNIEAFFCRRSAGGGQFLDYTDIDDKEVKYTAEVFRDIPGFRVDFRIDRTGPVYRLMTSRPNGCINTLVNGRPASPANVVPQLASSLVAIEIFSKPDSVPPNLQRYTWPSSSGLARTGRCTIVAYWTDELPHGSMAIISPP
jgi:hypothetical protein